MEERRRHRRYPLELPVRCRLGEPAGAPPPNLPGHTLDISEGGAEEGGAGQRRSPR